jgi:hypothetical protein
MKKFSAVVFLVILWSCSNKERGPVKQSYRLNQALTYFTPYDEGYPLTDHDIDEEAPFKAKDYVDYYSEEYKNKPSPPPFDFKMDLSHKTFEELRLLRAEILARHGYLFMDYVLRSHFNATKWYKPVFWYEDFQIKLSKEEKLFIDKVVKLEKKLYKQNYVIDGGFKKANTANVVNWEQFVNIPQPMMQHLRQDGFVINKANYEQLFHVYDENFYDYTPSFVTTDLYLQVLHMHISKEIQALEEQKLFSVLSEIIQDQYTISKKETETSKSPEVKDAAAWSQTYYAVALSLLSGEKKQVPASMNSYYQDEYTKAQEGEGFSSDFLGDSLIDYTQFQPRGNYTRTDSLKKYFRCVKWLNSAGIYLDEDARLRTAIFMGNALSRSEVSRKNYQVFSSVIQFLSGDENNLSFTHLIKVLDKYKGAPVDELLTKEKTDRIRAALYAMDPKRMISQGANERTQDFIARKRILFTAGRYTFDADILLRLVDVVRYNLKEEPKRPFPKGLDVFAAMGNETAESILLNVYKENEKWKDYSDSLDAAKKKFKGFDEWNKSVYNKTMGTVLSLQEPEKNAPYFVQLPQWRKKDLNTMLASWTGLKHDMILYIEQPSAAEMGDGGDIPPPQKIAYVEPRVEFWQNCIDLLKLNESLLNDNGLMTEKLKYRNDELVKLADFLLRMSKKELAGEKLSDKEFDELAGTGGAVEFLTLNIVESTEMSTTALTTPERYMAIATDVYTYNGKDEAKCLEETVGMGDEIYVIAEINGLLYLTRGAVFSQYEFTQPTVDRLTDEAWQKKLLDHKEPAYPVWMNDIKINVEHPKTAPNFNLY